MIVTKKMPLTLISSTTGHATDAIEGHDPHDPTGIRVSVEENSSTSRTAGWVFSVLFWGGFFVLVCLPERFAAGQSPGGFAEFPGVAGFTVPLRATVSKVPSLNCERICCSGEVFLE